jgi:hypothetical protein
MVPRKYRDVRRFYFEKYGKKIGAFKFQIYLLQKNNPNNNEFVTKNKFRANIIIF